MGATAHAVTGTSTFLDEGILLILRLRIIRQSIYWYSLLVLSLFPGYAHGEAAPLDTVQDYEARKATVLLFVDVSCPISNQYAPKVNELVQRFSEEGVNWFRVYSMTRKRLSSTRRISTMCCRGIWTRITRSPSSPERG